MGITKVCILQNGLARGGTDTFVLNLCKGLDKNQYRITVINPSNKAGSKVLEPDIQALGVQLLHTSDLSSGIISKCKHFWRLFKILRYYKFDVFHTNIDLFNGPNLFIAWLTGIPIRCCHSHNGMQQKELVEGRTLSIRIYQYLMRWMCWHFSNRRIGCSKIAMDFLFGGRNWEQGEYPHIINNGIDIEKYRKPIDTKLKRKELGLTNKYHIITIGRIIPQKNPLFIAELFSQFCTTRTDCDLIWIGEGPLKEECQKILSQHNVLDKVHFVGSRSDVNEILHCGDLFLLPSAFEGLGIVVIEAQAAGLPCVVSDAIPQEADCGGCEFISLTDEKHVWIQTISDVLDNNYRLVTDSRKLDCFSIDYMIKQMGCVFEGRL